jgi:GT2 family glycosyltransferase
MMASHGIVVIGRNEGERLRRCLAALRSAEVPLVYVDSCSHDGSAAWASGQGVDVLELDGSRPLSAARARNEGFAQLGARHPQLDFVQFVDGDCELHPAWLGVGVETLAARSEVGAVCGRVRERDPEASIYNLLCNLEWQKQPGYIQACGGNFMVRAAAFRAVGGFDPAVMAAEDDEFCLRLRGAGFKVLAVDADMVWHDAALLRFPQWWTRSRRAGMAYAQGAALHGASSSRHFQRECRSIWFWGLGLPALSLALAAPTLGASLWGFAGYPALGARIYRWGLGRGWSPREAGLYALFTVLGKSPELLGMLSYHYRTRWQQRDAALIEHKG